MNKLIELIDRLDSLTMTPKDWSKLNHMVGDDEYRKIVNDYQRRKEGKYPFCKLLFGVCRYWSDSRCTYSGYCGTRKGY